MSIKLNAVYNFGVNHFLVTHASKNYVKGYPRFGSSGRFQNTVCAYPRKDFEAKYRLKRA